MKNKILPVLVLGFSMLLASCGSKNFAMYSPEEVNLQSLNRITDNEDNMFDTPFGGDNNRNLFFAVRDKRGSSNIYLKENPISAAMSPKTSGKNVNVSPTFCAATNKLAYAGRQEGAFINDIFMLDLAQGAAIRRLTNTPTEAERFPCLSLDGRTIVFERCYAGGTARDCQIWSQDLQTESPTLLCQGRMPSLSHDGRSIVFVRITSDGQNACLVVMDRNGQNQTELTDAKMGIVGMPRFSPDDRQIVFHCMKKDKKDNDLYVINRDGTGLTQLTFNKSYDAEPYWANDGYIYFSSDRGGRRGNFQIWRFNYGRAYQGSYAPAPTYQAPAPAYSAPTPAPIQNSYSGTYHTVQNGETITDIARRYGITVRDVVKWNNLTTMTITPGMKLKVSAQ
mgnify:CR=1 FL=1